MNAAVPPIEDLITAGLTTSIREYFEVSDCVIVRATNTAAALKQYMATKQAAHTRGQVQTGAPPVRLADPVIVLRPTTYAVNRQSYPANRLARMGMYQGIREDVPDQVRKYGLVPVITQYDLLYIGNDLVKLNRFINRVIFASVRRGDLHYTVLYDHVNVPIITNFDETVTEAETTNAPDEVNQSVQQVVMQVEGYFSDYGKNVKNAFLVAPQFQGASTA